MQYDETSEKYDVLGSIRRESVAEARKRQERERYDPNKRLAQIYGRVMTVHQVARELGFSTNTLRAWGRVGGPYYHSAFPVARKCGPKSLRYMTAEIQAWLDAL